MYHNLTFEGPTYVNVAHNVGFGLNVVLDLHILRYLGLTQSFFSIQTTHKETNIVYLDTQWPLESCAGKTAIRYGSAYSKPTL